jgi:hypothetical protein
VNAHKEVVADQVSLGELKAFGIQALENEMGVIVRVEDNAHNGKAAGDDLGERLNFDLI